MPPKSRAQVQKEYRDRERAKDPVGYKKKQAKVKRDKYVLIALQTEKEQKKARRKSAASSKKHRKKTKVNPELPAHDPQSGKVNRGKNATRKRTSRSVSKLKRRLEKEETKRLKAERKADALRKKVKRMEKKMEEKRKEKNTPERKARKCMLREGLSPKRHAKLFKELLFFYTLVQQIHDRNTKRKSLTKRSWERHLAGKLMRKYRLLGHLAKHTGLNKNNLSLKKLSRKKKCRLVQERAEKKEKVVSFYLRDDVSQPKPGERDFVRIDKNTKIQARVLVDYQKINYLKFQAEFPFVDVSCAVFSQWRPAYVLLTKYKTLESCLCIYHENATLKLHAIGIKESVDYLIKTKTNREILQMATPSEMVYFEEWVKTADRNTDRLEKEALVGPYLKKLNLELDDFRQHVCRVTEQYTAVRVLKESIGPSEVIVQMDFAQNMTFEPQKAVQPAYWGQGQLTLHPTVWYMRGIDGQLKHESHVFLSDSPAHNTSSILVILRKLNRMLSENIDTIHYVTDSPPSQYRNRTMFHLIGNHEMLFRRKATWTYLEVGHGKGPCDGVGGTCKRQLRQAIKNEKVRIRNASEAVRYMKAKPGSSIEFQQYTPDEVEKAAMEVLEMDAQGIPAIMKLHAVKSVADGGQVSVRDTSCFCRSCKAGLDGCPGWRSLRIKNEAKRPRVIKVSTRKGQFVAFCCRSSATYAFGMVAEDRRQKAAVELVEMKTSTFIPGLMRVPNKQRGEDTRPVTIPTQLLLCNIQVKEEVVGPIHGTYRLMDGEEAKVKDLLKKKQKSLINEQ